MTPELLKSQEVKSDHDSKMLNFNVGFISYGTYLEKSLHSGYRYSSFVQPTQDLRLTTDLYSTIHI